MYSCDLGYYIKSADDPYRLPGGFSEANTSHLLPPFMTYNHGENNVNLCYERYTDSGHGRTSDKVKSHIMLEAPSSSSLGTSPPCVGSAQRSVLVQFQFFEGARLLPSQERTRRTRGRVSMTQMGRPWVPTRWRSPRAQVMAANLSSAPYGGSSTVQPRKLAIYISDDQHDHTSKTNRTNMNTHLFKRAPQTRRTPTPVIPSSHRCFPQDNIFLQINSHPCNPPSSSPIPIPSPSPSPGPTRFFPFLTEVEAKDTRVQHTPRHWCL